MVRRLLLLVLFLLSLVQGYCHGSWQAHKDDMMAVFGFEDNDKLTEWMKFISSDMIDSRGEFYRYLTNEHAGFKCKHRLLFHWGFNAEPWSKDLEARVIQYCVEYDLNIESNLRVFKAEFKAEQKRRNQLVNQKTEELFGFASGGRDAQYANFFASMAYNIHLIGDYLSDYNTDLEGLQNIDDIIGLIIVDILRLDKKEGRPLQKGITKIKKKYADPQKKADKLMEYLKKEMPKFILKAEDGSISRRLEKRGFKCEKIRIKTKFTLKKSFSALLHKSLNNFDL